MADITIRPLGAAIATEVDLDDGSTFIFDWADTQWGEAQQPEPEYGNSSTGGVVHYPLPEAWKRRELKLVGYRLCTSHYDKRYQMSLLATLFQGRRTIRRHGWEMDVTFLAPREVGESTKSPLVIAFEVIGYASPPFWRAVDSLSAIQWSTTLYPDYGIPPQEAMPAYLFGCDLSGEAAITVSPGTGVPHLTINNWGSAFVYPEISITGGPHSQGLYLKGPGNYRVPLPFSDTGAVTITASGRFYLAPGTNGLRIEYPDGEARDLSSYTTMRVDFGATKLRFL